MTLPYVEVPDEDKFKNLDRCGRFLTLIIQECGMDTTRGLVNIEHTIRSMYMSLYATCIINGIDSNQVKKEFEFMVIQMRESLEAGIKNGFADAVVGSVDDQGKVERDKQ